MSVPFYIQTFSGRAVTVDNPKVEDIDIVDIAHALSNQCRYGGHAHFFYSVAEHSLLVSELVPEYMALEALLHDASEAYMVDVPRPVKMLLSDYKTLENRLHEVIAAKFGTNFPHDPEVKRMDDAILFVERDRLLGPLLDPSLDEYWGPQEAKSHVIPFRPTITGMPPAVAKSRFLQRFEQLTNRKAA